MDIIKQTSTVHTSYYKNRPIQFLVIHYTAGVTSKTGVATSVAKYFGSASSRAASADFIVDDGSIVQFNGDIENRYTYAVGGNKYSGTKGAKFYGVCKNYNSISIEICSNNSAHKVTNPNDNYWFFTTSEINNAVELARYLMKKYNIPSDHLIRHWDVNGKPCPGIIGWNGDSNNNESKWLDFKNRVLSASNTQQAETNSTVTQSVQSNIQTKKEDELDMTIDEFIEKLTNEQAYQLMHKAMKYSDTLNEPQWSIDEGTWQKATNSKVVNGENPESYIKRDEAIAILGRLGLIT